MVIEDFVIGITVNIALVAVNIIENIPNIKIRNFIEKIILSLLFSIYHCPSFIYMTQFYIKGHLLSIFDRANSTNYLLFGKVTIKLDPLVYWDRTRILPVCLRIINFAMESPNPCPLIFRSLTWSER